MTAGTALDNVRNLIEEREFEKALSFLLSMDATSLTRAEQLRADSHHGRILFTLGRPLEALDVVQGALDRLDGTHPAEESDIHHLAGNLLLFLGRYGEALESYRNSLALKKRLQDEIGISNLSNNIGIACMNLGLFQESLQYHRCALEIREKLGREMEVLYSINEQANILKLQGQYEASEGLYQMVLERAEEREDQLGQMIGLGNLGDIYHRKGAENEAIGYYQRCLWLSQASQNLEFVGKTLVGLAQVHFALEEYASADVNLMQAQDIWSQLGYEDIETLLSLSLIYKCWGSLTEAQELVREAMTAAVNHGSMHEILSCLIAQAELMMEEQDFPEALAILELVEEMSERVSSFPTLIQSNLDLANLYFQLGDFWQAETSLNAAFEPANRQEVLPVVARCLLIAATLFAARGNIPEARRNLETTRHICQQKQLPLAQQITEVSKLIDAQEVMTNLPQSSAPPTMSSKEVLGYLTEVRWLLQ